MEIKLSLKDVVELYDFYKDHDESELYPSSTVRKKMRFNRLKRLHLLNEEGSLSRLRGKQAIKKLIEKAAVYKKGVDWEEYYARSRTKEWRVSHIIYQINHIPWIRVMIMPGRVYVTNREIIVAGKLIKNKQVAQSMRVDVLTSTNGFEKFIKDKIDAYVENKNDWEEIQPHTFCWNVFGNEEVTWFTNREQSIWIPVKSQYVKFILKRFSKKLAYFTKKYREESHIVVMSPPKKGMFMYKNAAACLLPLEETGEFKEPENMIEGWEERFDKKKRWMV